MDDVRQLLKTVYKAGMIFVTAVLVVGAVAAWWHATPANQLLLVAGILAVLALITGLSINKREWEEEQGETLRSIVDDVRDKAPFTLRFGDGGRIQWDLKEGADVRVEYAEPEVHRVDEATLAEAREMQRRGEPIDDICRRIDPSFDRQGEIYQQAFRRMVEAMLAES